MSGTGGFDRKMKVVKGPLKSQEVNISCHNSRCRAVFSATAADAVANHSDQRDGNCYEFKCEFCGGKMYANISEFWK